MIRLRAVYLRLEVEHSAHILLATDRSYLQSEHNIEVVIGEENNTKAFLRQVNITLHYITVQ